MRRFATKAAVFCFLVFRCAVKSSYGVRHVFYTSFPLSLPSLPRNHFTNTKSNMNFTCTCGVSVSSPSLAEHHHEGCSAYETGPLFLPSTSASPTKSGAAAPVQLAIPLRPYLNSPAHHCSTPPRYSRRRRLMSTPGFHLYLRLHLEAALTDAMEHNTLLQETVEKQEATIKELQQRLDDLEGN